VVLIHSKKSEGVNWLLTLIILAIVLLIFWTFFVTNAYGKGTGRISYLACKTVGAFGFESFCKNFELNEDGTSIKPTPEEEKEYIMCYDRFNQMLRDLTDNKYGVKQVYTRREIDVMFAEHLDFIRFESIRTDSGINLVIFKATLGSKEQPVYIGKFSNEQQLYIFEDPGPWLELKAQHYSWDEYLKDTAEKIDTNPDKARKFIMSELTLEGKDCREWWISKKIGIDYKIIYGVDRYGECDFPIMKKIKNAVTRLPETEYEKLAKTKGCDNYA